MKRSITTIVVLLGVATSVAQANPRLHSSNPYRAAYAAAVRYWHAKPCGGQVTINREAVPAEMLAFYTAQSEQAGNPPPFPGPDGLVIESWSADCAVHFNSRWWDSVSTIDRNYPRFCTDMVHEVGLLLGRGENSDPNSVMDQQANDAIPSQCLHFRLVGPRGRIWTAANTN